MPTRTPRRRRALEIVFFVVLIGVLLYRFGPELRSRAGLPAMAPDVRLTTSAGDTLQLSDLRGSIVVVNFWATWCAPCRVEMPMLQRVWEDYRARGFVVLGLYTDEAPIADLVAWYRGAGITYPFAKATPDAVRGFGQGSTLPTSFLVDDAGRVVERVEGIYPEDRLRSTLDRLLAARPGAPASDSSPEARPPPSDRVDSRQLPRRPDVSLPPSGDGPTASGSTTPPGAPAAP